MAWVVGILHTQYLKTEFNFLNVKELKLVLVYMNYMNTIQYWVGPSCFLSRFRGKPSLPTPTHPLTKRQKVSRVFGKEGLKDVRLATCKIMHSHKTFLFLSATIIMCQHCPLIFSWAF